MNKKHVLSYFIFLLFVFICDTYTVHAMHELDGELTYNGTSNITTCRCRFNSSQSTNISNNQWENNWKPNVVTGLATGSAFVVVGDLMNYDFSTQTYNSKIAWAVGTIIWPYCKIGGASCWSNTKLCCGSCVSKTSECCVKCSSCCRNDDSEEEPGVGKP